MTLLPGEQHFQVEFYIFVLSRNCLFSVLFLLFLSSHIVSTWSPKMVSNKFSRLLCTHLCLCRNEECHGAHSPNPSPP